MGLMLDYFLNVTLSPHMETLTLGFAATLLSLKIQMLHDDDIDMFVYGESKDRRPDLL